jgi:hypothetical protein
MAGLGFRPLFTEGPQPLIPITFRPVQNIKRDPFEQAVGESQKTVNGIGGALGGPLTAFLYDWNMLPIGQLLWDKEPESYKEFPPLSGDHAESCGWPHLGSNAT